MALQPVLGVLVATACGLLIGMERGWRQRDNHDGTRVAGVRTFTLLGALGGLCGVLAMRLHWSLPALLLGIVLAGLSRLTLSQLAKDGSVSATNLVAMALTLGLGMVATVGLPQLAIAVAILATRLCCKDWRQSEVGCRSAPIRRLLRNGG